MNRILLILNLIFLFTFLSIARAEEQELLVTEINWRKINDVEKLAEYAKNSALGFQLAAVRQARKLLSCRKLPPYDEFIESGIIPILVKFMYSKNTTLQFDSTWILAHIASGTVEQTSAIVEADSIPSFINLLNSSNKEILAQALWGLSHIIDKSRESREKCIHTGVIPTFAKLADSEASNIAIMRNIAWSLKNLCKTQSSKKLVKIEVIHEILPLFENFLKTNDSVILSETLSGIANCGNGSHSRIHTIISRQNLVKQVIPFLKNSNSKVQHSAFNVVKIIVNGNNHQKQTLLDNGIIEYMKTLIKSPNKHIKSSVLYILEKLLASAHQNVDELLDAKFIHDIVKLLKYNDYQIRIDAAKIILIVSKHPKLTKTLIKHGVIPKLCKMLHHSLKNDIDVILVLTTLQNIIQNSDETEKDTVFIELKNAGGTSLFSRFEKYENEKIKNISKEIIEFIYDYKKFE